MNTNSEMEQNQVMQDHNINQTNQVDPLDQIDLEDSAEPEYEFEEKESGEKESGEKFESPESGQKRLNKLPLDVLNGFRLSSIDTNFSILVSELQRRRKEMKTMEQHSFERMWTQTVYERCMEFLKEHKTFRRNSHDNISQDIAEYMKITPLVNLLQTFIDIAQQNGFFAKKCMDEMDSKNTNFSNRDWDEARTRYFTCNRLYYDFVELYQHCTGTWKPKRDHSQNMDRTQRGPREPREPREPRVQFDRNGSRENKHFERPHHQDRMPQSRQNTMHQDYPQQNTTYQDHPQQNTMQQSKPNHDRGTVQPKQRQQYDNSHQEHHNTTVNRKQYVPGSYSSFSENNTSTEKYQTPKSKKSVHHKYNHN